MIQFESDNSKNILRVRFSKNVEPDQTRLYVETAKTRIAELKPGFLMLTDLSGLSSMDAPCAPHIGKAMDVFRKGGVLKVVRVIPDPRVDIGFNIMSLFHYRRRTQIVTCETLAEAEKILAE
jgi:hypothetical protein